MIDALIFSILFALWLTCFRFLRQNQHEAHYVLDRNKKTTNTRQTEKEIIEVHNLKYKHLKSHKTISI